MPSGISSSLLMHAARQADELHALEGLIKVSTQRSAAIAFSLKRIST